MWYPCTLKLNTYIPQKPSKSEAVRNRPAAKAQKRPAAVGTAWTQNSQSEHAVNDINDMKAHAARDATQKHVF